MSPCQTHPGAERRRILQTQRLIKTTNRTTIKILKKIIENRKYNIITKNNNKNVNS